MPVVDTLSVIEGAMLVGKALITLPDVERVTLFVAVTRHFLFLLFLKKIFCFNEHCGVITLPAP